VARPANFRERSVNHSVQLTLSEPQRLALGVALGLTDIGTVRASNQDNFLIDAGLGLVAVADGMGGHAGGERASAEALAELAGALRATGAPAAPARQVAALRDAVDHANRRLYQANLANGRGDGSGMGTTLTGFWQAAPGAPLCVFHVGDTRLYRYRDGQLVQLTHDQTLYQQALDAGYQYNLPPRNLLLQALGPAAAISPELLVETARADDLYLLCSDGLHGACADESIAAVLAVAATVGLAACCAQLIEMAKRDGSSDNITAVLVRCDSAAPGMADSSLQHACQHRFP
jgi:serine/threonine protein phosphatase PrpC